jgi:spermidine/putrescine transport system substrate-binding protein
MPADMADAPEINVPAEYAAAGKFLPTCSPKAQEYYTAIWTELQK